MLLLSIGVLVAACSGADAGTGIEDLSGTAGAADTSTTGAGGGAGSAMGSSGGGNAQPGSGGAVSNAGGSGGSARAGGSNAGGSSSGGSMSGGGGASGAAGSMANGGAGGSDNPGEGTIWYDGEPAGLSYAAGVASLSAGSTAMETSDNPHSGTKSLSVSLNASSGWGHIGWTPSRDSKSYDLTTHAKLEFWIHAVSGTPTALQMEMHGPGGGCPWVNIKDYLPGGVTKSWQKVSIPLSAFKMDQKKIQVVDFWLSSGNAAFVIDDGRWN